MSMKTAKPPSLPVSTRYEFESPLGSGGMGTVYRALDRRTNSLVAIKVLKFKQHENPTLHQRLAREFKAASELEHPNIVQALAFETDGEQSFLVYELVEGGTVADRIEKHGALPEDIAIRIITQIAQALQYAHDHHVVHRDVKPDNIMLLPNGKAKLTDFGLAKDYGAEEDLTRQASGLGTPHFMAPEQFADAKNVDARSDIYSLGATLYNLVTGRLPFDAKTALAMLTMKEMCKYRLARSIVPSLNERIDMAIRSALDPDIDKRPATCIEFFKLLTGRRRLRGPEVVKTPAPIGNIVTPDRNRRSSVRYSLRVGSCVTIDSDLHGREDSRERWPLVVRDVSTDGIGVLLARRFEPGTDFRIDLPVNCANGAKTITARVVRVESERAGHWIHGCAFARPLNGEQVKALLKYA